MGADGTKGRETKVPKKRVIHYFSENVASDGDVVCSMLETLFGVTVLKFTWDVDEIEEDEVKKDIPVLCIFVPPLRGYGGEGGEREVWEKVKDFLPSTPALWLSPDEGSKLPFLRRTKVIYTERGGAFVSFVRAVQRITGIAPNLLIKL